MKIHFLLFLFVAGLLFGCSSSRAISDEQSRQRSAQELESLLNIPEIDLSEINYFTLNEISKKSGISMSDLYVNNIYSFLNYPVPLRKKKIEGELILDLLITKEGELYVTGIKSNSSLYFAEELIKTLKDESEKPFYIDGKPVNAFISALPISLRLEGF